MQRGPAFISELLSVIPNAHYYKRGTYDLKKVLVITPSSLAPSFSLLFSLHLFVRMVMKELLTDTNVSFEKQIYLFCRL